jgi:hypothetical protein
LKAHVVFPCAGNKSRVRWRRSVPYGVRATRHATLNYLAFKPPFTYQDFEFSPRATKIQLTLYR